MATISPEQKTNMQMVFKGLSKYTRQLNLDSKYQKDIDAYMQSLWGIVKEFGTPESSKADTKESENYWTEFIRKDSELYEQYIHWSKDNQYDFIKLLHWFVFDLIQITERMDGTTKHI